MPPWESGQKKAMDDDPLQALPGSGRGVPRTRPRTLAPRHATKVRRRGDPCHMTEGRCKKRGPRMVHIGGARSIKPRGRRSANIWVIGRPAGEIRGGGARTLLWLRLSYFMRTANDHVRARVVELCYHGCLDHILTYPHHTAGNQDGPGGGKKEADSVLGKGMITWPQYKFFSTLCRDGKGTPIPCLRGSWPRPRSHWEAKGNGRGGWSLSRATTDVDEKTCWGDPRLSANRLAPLATMLTEQTTARWPDPRHVFGWTLLSIRRSHTDYGGRDPRRAFSPRVLGAMRAGGSS